MSDATGCGSEDAREAAVRCAVAEPSRLAAIADRRLDQPVDDPELDALVELLAQVCDAPAAGVSIVTPGRQGYLARYGTDLTHSDVDDPLSFCADVVTTRATLVVPDAAADPRFSSSPFVASGAVTSYAGAPLVDDDGHVLGSLCVINARGGELTAVQVAVLTGLARQVLSLLQRREQAEHLADALAAREADAVALAASMTAQRRDAQRLEAATRVLELVATGQPLASTLDRLAREVEAAAPDVRCSVLLLDPTYNVLRDAAGPSLPPRYRETIDAFPVADGAGCCGTAAATRGPAIATDIATDPRWAGVRDMALEAGLRACWSLPITGSNGSVLGTFALYYSSPRGPAPEHAGLVDQWSHIAGLAIERELVHRQLEHVARHDPLTGLPNRTAFFATVTRALALRAREGDEAGAARDGATALAQHDVAVLFVDLDRFKVLNDSLGHSVGDAYLSALANRLRARISSSAPGALLGRLGGDEFAVVLPAVTAERALEVAAAVLAAFADPVVVNRRPIRLSASVGVAVSCGGLGEAVSAESLLRDADAAMYEAKRRGRGQAALFTAQLRERALIRLELEVALRDAVARDQLTLAYQPEYGVPDGRLRGVEVLLRWQREDATRISPAEFIPLAEECGLIGPLGEFVLRRACAQAAQWRAEHPGFQDVITWVNLSSQQLEHDDLPGLVARVLSETGLPADRLGLEITESGVVADVEVAGARLLALKELGVHLAIDDFGSGYSSLAQLTNLPVDVLKIDRQFVARLPGRAGERVIAAVVQMAHALDLTVIAEGVETQEQLAALGMLGCDTAQGFLLAAPMTAEALADVLARLATARCA